jgi:HlyD family secretion protein
MTPVRSRVALAIAIVVLAGLGAWLFFGLKSSATLTLYGNVDVRQVDLAFAVDGPLKEVLVEEGDAVKRGQPLARLDATAYQHGLAEAQAHAAQAHAALAKAERGNRVQDIESARAAVAEARAQLRNAEATFTRQQALVKEGTTSRQALDNAQRDLNVARAAVTARDAALRLSQEGFRSEDIDAARAAAAAADAGVGLAQFRLDNAVIAAPNDGTILTRIREPGAMVGPMQPIFTLSLTNPVWVRTYVDEPYLGRVVPGTKVNVTTDGPDGKTYPATIGFVSPTAEFTPKTVETPELRSDLVYRVRVFVDAPDRGLRQGMPVTVTFTPDQTSAQAR